MIFKSIPFINSSRRKEYLEFVCQPFNIGMVGLVNGESHNNQTPYFFDWLGASMVHWIKFNNDKFTIEFYVNGSSYKIINNRNIEEREFKFPFPKTLDHFISDTQRCGIELEWSDHVIKCNDIKNILSQSDYKTYIDDLLNSIGKGEDSKN